MFGPNRWMVAVALVLVSPAAFASPQTRATGATAARAGANRHSRQARVKRHDPAPRACFKAAVALVRGVDTVSVPLAKCDGGASPEGVEKLSALAGARGATKLDPRLVEELEVIVEHFRSAPPASGAEVTERIVLVSGYRPKSAGSYHARGRALDFRMDGVKNEALVAFCRTLPDTGCGYYPNAGFVHLDVREAGAGHVSWTDVSRPGEAPRYVNVADVPGPTALPALPPRARTDASPDAAADAPAHKTRAQEPLARPDRDERLHSI